RPIGNKTAILLQMLQRTVSPRVRVALTDTGTGQQPCVLSSNEPSEGQRGRQGHVPWGELGPTSPTDLYNRISEAIPYAEGTFLRQEEIRDMYSPSMSTYGVFKILDVLAFEQMPMFLWQQMFTMFSGES
ncbi:MAG: hypothetical protein ACKPKO_42770, partial [Candidatus Fonsibacter sp.]